MMVGANIQNPSSPNSGSTSSSHQKSKPRTGSKSKKTTTNTPNDSKDEVQGLADALDSSRNNRPRKDKSSKPSSNKPTTSTKDTRTRKLKEAKKVSIEDGVSKSSSNELLKNKSDGGNKPERAKKSNRRRRHGKTADDKKKQPDAVEAEKMKEIDNLQRRRQEEIDQCIHVLGSDGFKLFKNGRYVTTYNIPFNAGTKFTEEDVKFSINVPTDYPKSAIKLSSNKCNSQSQSKDSRLNNVVSNFNYKARQLNKQGYPIFSQLNYFFEELDFLMCDDFRDLDNMKQKFYAQFC